MFIKSEYGECFIFFLSMSPELDALIIGITGIIKSKNFVRSLVNFSVSASPKISSFIAYIKTTRLSICSELFISSFNSLNLSKIPILLKRSKSSNITTLYLEASKNIIFHLNIYQI